MNVLMISIDRGLLGGHALGDVVKRHADYGRYVDRLDIIVFTRQGFSSYQIAANVNSFPTNSKNPWHYVGDGMLMGGKLFKEQRYDLIVCQDPFLTGFLGARLKKKFGPKLLVHFHGDFWKNPLWLREHKTNYILLALSRYVVKVADGIRVVSSGIKNKLIHAGVPGKKIFLLPTLVDIQKYFTGNTDGIGRQTKLVLQVSRYDTIKDFPMLARAFKLVKQAMPDVTLMQIGGGEKAAKEMPGVDVNFKPLIPSEELLTMYQQATVVVLSSKSESLGKVLIEASASGAPIVSTKTTGAQEIIEDGVNGYLVPIGDAKKLAEKIIYLLQHPDVAHTMGERGRELMKKKFNFTAADVVAIWQTITKP